MIVGGILLRSIIAKVFPLTIVNVDMPKAFVFSLGKFSGLAQVITVQTVLWSITRQYNNHYGIKIKPLGGGSCKPNITRLSFALV